MTFDKTFLEDEVRLGFYIPSSIKQLWAAELEVLSEIDKICTTENITYFADWGTFLGAVRHRGFVPWDDDMDIVMFRKDYDRFLKLAPSLLPEGYSVHTFRNEEGFQEFHAVVLNTEHARFDKEHFDRFHGFNYICGIDIFVLDYVYSDENREKQRVYDTTYIIAFADGMLKGDFGKSSLDEGFRRIEEISGKKFDRSKSPKELWIELYELAEKKCAEVPENESEILTQMVPWGLKSDLSRRYSKADYASFVRLPFEYTTIPVPLFYTKLLSKRYSNYLTLVKNAGAHDYPFFEKQINDLQKLMGMDLPHFSFEPTLIANVKERNESWKDIIRECINNIEYQNNIALSLSDVATEAIRNAQQLAIDMGNLIENLKGENHPSIKTIEKYCESLYVLYQCLDAQNTPDNSVIKDINASFENMANTIEETLLSHKNIVFIPFKDTTWNSFEDIYNKCKADDKNDIYVIPVPLYYKEYNTSLSGGHIDTNDYPDNVNLTDYTVLSLEFLHPDIIYFQTPYDEYNPSFSIHPDFYSSKLRNYTDKLIYVPWFSTYDFDKSEARSYKNMNSYVTVPGVVYADEIILSSEMLKNTYVEKLTEWSNEQYKDYWNSKITVIPKNSGNNNNQVLKTILYYIGISDACLNISDLSEKVRESFNLFREYSNRVNVITVLGNNLYSELNNINSDFPKTFKSLIDSLDIDSIQIINENNLTDQIISKCDAYYGDAEYLATIFSEEGKPVMIQNYSLK